MCNITRIAVHVNKFNQDDTIKYMVGERGGEGKGKGEREREMYREFVLPIIIMIYCTPVSYMIHLKSLFK